MEITAVAAQTVASGQNVVFTDVVIPNPTCSILHRPDSGIVTLRGLTHQCKARYKVYFSGNVGVPSTGTAAVTTLAVSISGEAVGSSIMNAPATTVGETTNVSTMILVDVPQGCCVNISIQNNNTISELVQNANLIVERVA